MSACRGCGKEIIWGKTEDGKKIPLDPVPPVYRFFVTMEEDLQDNAVERAGRNYMVSHFATCKNANDFSASRKPK